MIVQMSSTDFLISLREPEVELRASLNIGPLVQSMKERGFIWDTETSHGIKVQRDSLKPMGYVLLGGLRRIMAAKACGIDWLPVHVVNRED